MESRDKFKRLSGSIIGESTFLGLIKLVTGYDSVDAFIGDSRSVDMTVGDIYGGDYESLGLNKDIIASSMGKAKNINPNNVNKQDLARSILTMICLNVAQLAILVSRTENIDNIVVMGSILNHIGFQVLLKVFTYHIINKYVI